MAKAKTTLLEYCKEGYSDYRLESPYLATSPADYAWRVGRYMREHGITAPVACWAGRGDKVNVHTAASEYVAIVRHNGPQPVTLERVFL